MCCMEYRGIDLLGGPYACEIVESENMETLYKLLVLFKTVAKLLPTILIEEQLKLPSVSKRTVV